ncbi:MAG: hypothetical protein KJ625_03370, partial [Actinobacteria bacterium]|nr:hypothetical protein [Actinomycetota bacterium]
MLALVVAMLFPATAFANWNGGHSVVGHNGTSRTWYFAEGTTRSGFNEWVCLLNPNVGATVASVTYMLENKEPVVKSYYLPALSRTTVDVASEVEAGTAGPFREVVGVFGSKRPHHVVPAGPYPGVVEVHRPLGDYGCVV